MSNPIIIRKIDDLGRFVLPIDVRKKLKIMPGDSLEMTISNDCIQIKKSSSIQNLVWLANIILKSLLEIYKIESALDDNEKILVTTQKNKKNEYRVPILYENKKIGNYIVYNYEKQDEKMVNFVVSIFKKYLEEQG